MVRTNFSSSLYFAAAVTLAAMFAGGCTMQGAARQSKPQEHWSTTWGASETVPAPNSPAFNNQTLRLIVRTTSGGESVRIKIANYHGTRALSIGGASVALQQAGASLLAGSNHRLTFSGHASITIPIGAYVLSDAAPLTVSAQQNLAVSVFIPSDSGPVTIHPLALQTSFVSGSGDFSARDDAEAFPTQIQSWPYLVAVEVNSAAASRSIVAFGDSITDGYRSTMDANRRWPDYLSARLLAAHQPAAIVNEGISGNRIWHDALPARSIFGPSGLSRFDRDALGITGATHIIVLLGINDIGQASPTVSPEEQVGADEIIAGLRQFALRAHARGLKIIGATYPPYGGAAYFSAQGEEKRRSVNEWIRKALSFDGVIDFDAAVRDPEKPMQLKAPYDSGDHLHPSDEGYKAMADAIDLKLFE